MRFTRRRLLASGLFVVSTVAFLYFVLPKLLGLKDTWNRIEHGNGWWLGFAAVLEVCSFAGYVALFRAVFVRGKTRIGWRESYQITMSGLAATRLFAAAGAGGIALTAWALRRSGMEPKLVACRMIAFMALLYGVYMGALVIVGLGLYTGLIPGGGSFALTVVPAIFGASAIAVFLAVSLLPGDFDRRLDGWAQRTGTIGRIAQKRAAGGGAGGGRDGRAHRDRPRALAGPRTLLGAVAVLGLRHRRPLGLLSRLRHSPAAGRDRDVLLRRDARQHAAAPGRDRRRRRRHDRRVHGLRGQRRGRGRGRALLPRIRRSGCRRSCPE